ncbi:MAG: spore germination protein [Firmicutes bacterium]|nr:spore germination protein [Bacillota bacterium]
MSDKNSPDTEQKNTKIILNGSQEGFTVDLQTNLELIRSKLVSDRLKFKPFMVGALNPKQVAVVYLEGVAPPQLLKRLSNKILGLEVEQLIGPGQLETLIKDFPRSSFPQFQATVKPEHAINYLLKGKYLILFDGTPVTLTAPITFFDFFQNQDDLNYHWPVRSFLRLLRFLATVLAVFFPALYVAIISFHYYIIPVNFLIPLAESWAQVPFPPVVEVLFLETIIEILREATLRLTSPVHTSIGLIGGVLLGVAALSTGTISSSTLIVSMVTLIASLMLPICDLGTATRILKFIAILFAAVFGVLGLVVTASLIFAHLVTLESLGEAYLQTTSPLKLITSSWGKRPE